MELLKYYHTLKYLKPEQFIYRLLRKVVHPRKRLVDAELISVDRANWVDLSIYQQKLWMNDEAEFLNSKFNISSPDIWNNDSLAKLWLYNLHYFDDLNAVGKEERKVYHLNLLRRWISENPWGQGNGWEPYPTSLRVVNVIKACMSGLVLDQELIDSLKFQTDYLRQDLERHLLGNHLFANAKALVFSGLFFSGKSADDWLITGLRIYEREIKEQVLPDGGNFELTPMYHSIMLVDLLDLVNIFNIYPEKVPLAILDLTRSKIKGMLSWLNEMIHLDGEISFFNDSALGIAPTPETIRDYASGLSIESRIESDDVDLSCTHLSDSGYVSVRNRDIQLIADIGNVGPDYIPGHAHADTLSFELSLFGKRLFVNSGTSEYGLGAERHRQRSTQAHNTVSVNSLNSSQVWSGFRVAKRGRVSDVSVVSKEGIVDISASHDGFQQQGVSCIHIREWKVSNSALNITDELKGRFSSATGFLYLSPDVKILDLDKNQVIMELAGRSISLSITGGECSLQSATWHPRFGVVLDNQCLEIEFMGAEVNMLLSWEKS